MADELKQMLGATEGEGPSPEFVVRLGARLTSEQTQPIGLSAGEPANELSEIHLPVLSNPSNPAGGPRTVPWKLLAAAAAAVLVAAVGIGALNNAQTQEDPISTVATQPETSPTAETLIPAAEAALAGSLGLEDATVLVEPFVFLDTGAYVTEQLGTPLGFTVKDQVLLREIRDGYMRLAAVDGTDDVGDQILEVVRLSNLSNPTDPTVPLQSFGDGWPATDFEGWIDNLSAGITVSEQQAMTIGGTEAVRADIRATEVACAGRCVFFGTNHLAHEIVVDQFLTYRVWIIDQTPYDPLAVIAFDDKPLESGWFELADQIVDTIVLGPPAPNPVVAYGPGEVDLPILGGVSTSLDNGLALSNDQPGNHRATFSNARTRVDFMTSLYDPQGEPITTSEALIETLRSSGLDVTPAEPLPVDGLEADVLDVGGFTSWNVRLTPDVLGAWWLAGPTAGRVWIVEHPERGLLIVGALGEDAAATDMTAVIERAENLLRRTEFIKSG